MFSSYSERRRYNSAPPSGKVQILCAMIDGIDDYFSKNGSNKSNSYLSAYRMLALRDLKLHYPVFMAGDFGDMRLKEWKAESAKIKDNLEYAKYWLKQIDKRWAEDEAYYKMMFEYDKNDPVWLEKHRGLYAEGKEKHLVNRANQLEKIKGLESALKGPDDSKEYSYAEELRDNGKRILDKYKLDVTTVIYETAPDPIPSDEEKEKQKEKADEPEWKPQWDRPQYADFRELENLPEEWSGIVLKVVIIWRGEHRQEMRVFAKSWDAVTEIVENCTGEAPADYLTALGEWRKDVVITREQYEAAR